MWSYLAISRVGDGQGLPENILKNTEKQGRKAWQKGSRKDHEGFETRLWLDNLDKDLFHICVAELEIEDIDVLCQSGLWTGLRTLGTVSELSEFLELSELSWKNFRKKRRNGHQRFNWFNWFNCLRNRRGVALQVPPQDQLPQLQLHPMETVELATQYLIQPVKWHCQSTIFNRQITEKWQINIIYT